MQEGDFDFLVCVAIDSTSDIAGESGEVVLLDWWAR